MKILDTNAINHVLKNRINLQDEYFITPDIREEAEIVESLAGRRLPPQIFLISNFSLFNEAQYLIHYKSMLNKHNGRSFYNMTGFGDISILAFLKTVEEAGNAQRQRRLFEVDEEWEVFTEDSGLINKIKVESNKTKISKNVYIK